MIEKEILGCILQDNSLIGETVIKATYFSKQEHQLLFQSMQKLASEGKAIDKVTLIADNYEYIQQLGGPAFITEIEMSGKSENFETYEKQLLENYKRRQSKLVAKQYTVVDKELDQLIEELQGLNEIGIKEEQSTQDLLKEMFNQPYEDSADVGIPSGLVDLDKVTGGF